MAESSVVLTFFSCFCLLTVLNLSFLVKSSESLGINFSGNNQKKTRENSVTFLGYLNDPEITSKKARFSALLEVELFLSKNAQLSSDYADKGQSGNAEGGLWMATPDSKVCHKNNVYGVAKIDSETTGENAQLQQQKSGQNEWRTLQLVLPVSDPHQPRTLYLCHGSGQDPQGPTQGGPVWTHMGVAFSLPKVTPNEVLNVDNEYYTDEEYILERPKGTLESRQPRSSALQQRQSRETAEDLIDPANNSKNGVEEEKEIQTIKTHEERITNFRLITLNKDVKYADNDGVIEVLEGYKLALDVYGHGFTKDSQVILSTSIGELGEDCKSDETHIKTNLYFLSNVSPDGTSAILLIPGEDLKFIKEQETYYSCLKNGKTGKMLHQGSKNTGTQVRVYQRLLPVWFMVCLLTILLCLSGLFSGLNLGLMALDQTELKIVQNTGSDKEKEYANKIQPIRAHGNFLLCSLLLGNVLVNNSLTILLDTLTSGVVAIIGATMGIVVFGEIIPQAICSRHGLAVGAYTIWLTKFFMLLTFPLSFPISKLLDCLLGAEIGTVYDKKKLIELLKVTNDNNDLEKEEVDIVTGALRYKEKTVRDIMTKLDDVYMLALKTILNFETVSEIREQGYSRIPVYDTDRSNIVHVLFAKDLMFIDPDDNMPLSMVCEFYQNDVTNVFDNTPLNVMFNDFKSGERGHMAFVQEVNSSGEGDPFYETVGLVTLEDIIEEIIQQEIVDETDVVMDNRSKKKRRRENFKSGTEGTTFHQMFGEGSKKIAISPQLTLAVFQYLTTTIEPFRAQYMSEVVLKRLLTMDLYREIKLKKDANGKQQKQNEEELILMTKGKAIDYFVLIIEGKVEVNIGREELIFESGPFTYFGIQTLNQVIESPSSPLLAYKVTGNGGNQPGNAQVVGTPPSITSNDITKVAGSNDLHRSLRKASTQQSIEVPDRILNNKRRETSGDIGITSGALNSGVNIPSRIESRTGSVAPSVTYQAFIPDYTIKAVTDVLYLKIKRSTYSRALKASLMGKKAGHSGAPLNERELENLLEKVEDESMDHDLNMMLRTPVAHSPNQSNSEHILEHEVTRVKVTNMNSGASTPTLATRGDPTRMSLASRRTDFDAEDFKSDFIVNKVEFPLNNSSSAHNNAQQDSALSNNMVQMDRGSEVRIPAGAGNIGPLREANGDAGAALVGKNDNIENSIKIEAANSENTAGSDNDSNSIRINLLNNANSASNAS